jgi:hypothetical protein
MSASPNPTFLEPWSLPHFTDEELATLDSLEQAAAAAGSLTSQASVSSDAATINTQQSASTGSTGPHRAGIDTIGQRESAGPEQQECFSEHSSNDYHVFTSSSESASSNSGDLDTQLAGANSTNTQSGHGFSALIPEHAFSHTLFNEGHNSKAPSSQLDYFINDANASCPPHLLSSEADRQQYQHATSQAPAQSWEQLGGSLAYDHVRNDYVEDYSSNRWFDNMSNHPLYQFPSQLTTSCSFHIPDEPQLTIGPSINIELDYCTMEEKETIQKTPRNSSGTQDSGLRSFEDVQPQPESARLPLPVSGLSGPIRPNVNSQNTQRGSHKNSSVSRLFTQRQRRKQRGAFTDPLQRVETGETRKRGACLRCRMQRIRVSPSNSRS